MCCISKTKHGTSHVEKLSCPFVPVGYEVREKSLLKGFVLDPFCWFDNDVHHVFRRFSVDCCNDVVEPCVVAGDFVHGKF